METLNGRCNLGQARLVFRDNDLIVGGDWENIIVAGNQCQVISGPDSIVVRVDYLHINAPFRGDIEITNPRYRQCHTNCEGGVVIRVNISKMHDDDADDDAYGDDAKDIIDITEEEPERGILQLATALHEHNSGGEDFELEQTAIRDIEPFREKTCTICRSDFAYGELHSFLPCTHGYHTACIGRWLHESPTCPDCKINVFAQESMT